MGATTAKLFDNKNLSNVVLTVCRATRGLVFGRKCFQPNGLILTLVVMAFTLGAILGFRCYGDTARATTQSET